MTHQLPAEIAEAIEALQIAAEQFGGQTFITPGDGEPIIAARAALDAVILKHLVRWRPMSEAPQKGRLLAIVDDEVRVIAYGKTSHVPIYGWCLADQGAEEFDICKPTAWMPLPSTDLGRAALADDGRGT